MDFEPKMIFVPSMDFDPKMNFVPKMEFYILGPKTKFWNSVY